MTEEETARAMAVDWQSSHPRLAGFEPHLKKFDGYWWASFGRAGTTKPSFGGTVLLIDVPREALTAASGSCPPSKRIADYEASLRES